MKSILKVLAAPFKFGAEWVDARPSGGTIRQLAGVVSAVEATDGKAYLSVGPAHTKSVLELPDEKIAAVNAAIKFVGHTTRSAARKCLAAHHEAVYMAEASALAQAKADKAEARPTRRSKRCRRRSPRRTVCGQITVSKA